MCPAALGEVSRSSNCTLHAAERAMSGLGRSSGSRFMGGFTGFRCPADHVSPAPCCPIEHDPARTERRLTALAIWRWDVLLSVARVKQALSDNSLYCSTSPLWGHSSYMDRPSSSLPRSPTFSCTLRQTYGFSHIDKLGLAQRLA